MDDDRQADRTALQELKASYFRFLDTKKWASWRELFTDDMVFFNDDAAIPTSTEPMTAGGDDFVEMVSSTLANAVTVHQGHMPELRFVDERNATGVWAMFDWVDSSGSGGGSSMQGFGHYHEQYRKGDDGRWRIAELRLTRLRVDSSPPTGAVTNVAPWTRSVSAG
jgi:hypothetical protein